MSEIELVEWQRRSPTNGLVQSWWTHPMLDLIETWDWKDKTLLEFGCGLGTAWLRDRCKWVDSIDADPEWALRASHVCDINNKANGQIYCKKLADSSGTWDEYIALVPRETEYDIISIDGIYRTECIEWAINHFNGREGLLIIDNLNQDFVWISPKAMELIAPYKGEVFIQPGHTNHEGKPWNTRYIKIPAK